MLSRSAARILRATTRGRCWQQRQQQQSWVRWHKGALSVTTGYAKGGEEASGGGDNQEEAGGGDDQGRSLLPEALYGFSVLTLAGVWATKDDKREATAESYSPNSFIARFGLRAAEPLRPNDAGGGIAGGVGGGGGGGKGLSRRQQNNFIADVVSETAPCLVRIEIKDTAQQHFYTGEPITLSNGSGFIVKSDGLIVTNAHVVVNKPRSSIQVRLHSGEVFAGEIEDVDVKSDLATVRIPCRNLPVMQLGSSSDLRPGEFVVAMGSPLSLSNTITTGVVSNVARASKEMNIRGRDIEDYIQTDAAITFGNSGGPLINLDGEAIGVNSLKVTPGISFAIPIDHVKEFLKKSEEAGKNGKPSGKRRYIGITMASLNQQMLDLLKFRDQIPESISHGILVYKLVRRSPADRSGLREGDIITHINDSPLFASRDVYKILEGQASPLVLRVCRDKKFLRVVIQPDDQLLG